MTKTMRMMTNRVTQSYNWTRVVYWLKIPF
jgi:hypothetical protein